MAMFFRHNVYKIANRRMEKRGCLHEKIFVLAQDIVDRCARDEDHSGTQTPSVFDPIATFSLTRSGRYSVDHVTGSRDQCLRDVGASKTNCSVGDELAYSGLSWASSGPLRGEMCWY